MQIALLILLLVLVIKNQWQRVVRLEHYPYTDDFYKGSLMMLLYVFCIGLIVASMFIA